MQLTSNDDPSANVETQQRLQDLEGLLVQLPAHVSTTLLLHRFAGFSTDGLVTNYGSAARGYRASIGMLVDVQAGSAFEDLEVISNKLVTMRSSTGRFCWL